MSVYKGTMGDDHASWAEYINVEGLHGCMKDGYGKMGVKGIKGERW